MANIMSMVKLKNKTSRNGFDLGRKNAFTAKVGEILPVACIECLPGDSFDMEIQHFTRTRPVNTAAYTRIREYFDWFFVPSDLLWNKFGSVITEMTDNGQHAQGIKTNEVLSTTLPHTTLEEIGDYLTAAKGKLNAYGYDRSNLSNKLLSYLGYGDLSFKTNDPYTDANAIRKNLAVNLFPLLAYQKVYSDYYRNSQWEKAYAPSWNLDYIKGVNDLEIPIADLTTDLDNTENMFDLRYRNWNKDLFMGVLPSAQYGDTASIMVGSSLGDITDGYDSFTTNGWANLYVPEGGSSTVLYGSRNPSSKTLGIDVFPVNSDGTVASASHTGCETQLYISKAALIQLRDKLGLSSSNASSGFSILQLRYAEAQQMWKEITQSVQQDYKSQIEAHWNVDLSDAYSDRCKYIGGSVSNLDISEVVNTNITETNEASIAGKGVGAGQSKEKFSTKIHGYLMCLYSAVPLLDYSISGVKRMCTRTEASDFAIPEFDAVGMEPLGVENLYNSYWESRVPSPTEVIDTLGYVPRYIDYKTAYDEVNGAFRKEQDGLNDWVAPLTNSYFESYFADLVDVGLGAADSLTYQFFKVNPNILNPIFDVNADSSVSTDQLWVNSAFDIKAVRSLDRNGLPY